MKKFDFKKILLSKWFIIGAAVVVVLAAAGITLGVNYDNWFKKETKASEQLTTSKDVFWNVEMETYAFQSSAFTSSREVDEDDGYYHVLFSDLSQQGRAVTRRVKDKKVVDKIDRYHAMGLVFDSKNIVVDVIPLEKLNKQISVNCGYVSNVSEDGNLLTLNTSQSLKGESFELKLDPMVNKYDVVGVVGEPGNPLSGGFKPDDCIYAISDMNGRLQYVCLVDRLVMKSLYFNYERKYDKAKGVSTRVANAEGYYEFNLAHDGTSGIFKTKDINIVKSIDSTATNTFGLDVDETGIITKFYSAKSIYKGSSTTSWFYVEEINEDNYVARKYSSGVESAYGNPNLARKYVVYDVSKVPGSTFGAETTLRVGDQIHALRNANDEVALIWVVGGRTVDAEMCYNYTRMYSTSKGWYRTPEADGRYVFELGVFKTASKGKYWTRDKALAEKLDSGSSTKLAGIKFKGDEIVGVYTAKEVTGGGSFASWYNIDTITENGQKLTCTKHSTGAKATGILDANCIIIDPKNGFKPCKLVVGDQIHGVLNKKGRVEYIFIVEKAAAVVKNAYCSHCNKVVPWYNLSGTPKNGYHYILTENLYGQPQYSFGGSISNSNKDKYIAGTIEKADCVLDLNGHTLSATDRAICVGYGSKLTIFDSVGTGVIKSEQAAATDYGYGVLVCPYGKCDMYGGTFDFTGFATENYGAAIVVRADAVFNMYGGQIKNGTAIAKTVNTDGEISTKGGMGGNVYLSSRSSLTSTDGKSKITSVTGGTFNMYGGKVSGGKAVSSDLVNSTATGGNFYLGNDAVLNLYDGVIENGTAFYGGNIRTAGGHFNMYGGTVSGGHSLLRQYVKDGANKNADGQGGNCFIDDDSTINGGVIENGVSDGTATGGGNIYLGSTNSNLVINGGVIRDGVSKLSGRGNILITSKDTAKLTVKGGLITSTKGIPSGYFGGGVYVNTGVLNISGAPQIKNNFTTGQNASDVYLASGKIITASGLTSGAEIGVLMASPSDSFAPNAASFKDYFFSDDTTKSVIVKNVTDLGFDVKKEESLCKICNKTVEWTVWNGNSSLLSGGHYYLAEDVTISGTHYLGTTKVDDTALTPSDAKTYCIDFRGHKLTSTAGYRVIVVQAYMTANLFDSANTAGGIYAANTTAYSQGRGLWARANSTVNVYDINIDMTGASKDTKNGQALAIEGGTVNMYSGLITGGKVQGNGACVYVSSNAASKFNMYGGTIGTGSADGKGNSLYAAGNVNLNAGTIKDAVAFASSVKATVKGACKLETGKIYFTDEVSAAIIDKNEVVTPKTISKGDYTLPTSVTDGGMLKVGENATSTHSHCLVCGLEECSTHGKMVDFVALNQNDITNKYSDALPSSGNYYLTENIVVTKQTKPSANAVLNICLNGFNIGANSTATDAGRFMSVSNTGVKVSITDCHTPDKAGAIIRSKVTSSAQGSVIWYNVAGSELNIYNGTIDASNVTLTRAGTAGTAILIQKGSTLNMYGGTVIGGKYNFSSDNTSKLDGGATIYISGSTFNQYGGTVKGGTAASAIENLEAKGGNIYLMSKSTYNMYEGAVVEGGHADDGGNIYIDSGCKMNMYGGTVKDGVATVIELKNPATASENGNLWGGNGGNIYAKGVFNMEGGTVASGLGKGNGGGNIYFKDGSVANISGGLVKDGLAHSAYKGNIYVQTGAKLTVSGGTVTYTDDFTVSDEIKNYLENDVLNSKGDAIIKKVALENAMGGIYVGKDDEGTSNLTLTGTAVIKGCKHNVYLITDATIDVGELETATASIGISMAANADVNVFAKNGKDYVSCFVSDLAEYDVSVNNNGLSLNKKPV